MIDFIRKLLSRTLKNTTFDPKEYFPLDEVTAVYHGYFKEKDFASFDFRVEQRLIGTIFHKNLKLYVVNRIFIKQDGFVVDDEDMYFGYSPDGNSIEKHGQYGKGLVSFYPDGSFYLTNIQLGQYQYNTRDKLDTISWKWKKSGDHQGERLLYVKKKFYEGRRLLRIEKILYRKGVGLWAYEEKSYFPYKNIIKYVRMEDAQSQVVENLSPTQVKHRKFIPTLVEYLNHQSVRGFVLLIHKDRLEEVYHSTRIGNPTQEIQRLIEEHFVSYDALESLLQMFDEEDAGPFLYMNYDETNCIVIRVEESIMHVFFLSDRKQLLNSLFADEIIRLWNQFDQG
ncbi:hypothetical protein PghCCS26_39140 [Paenibacillus glycanilyticus]|uniref:Uncharacterized protein n=1 Tax=Paenibacillus glycanilyticus TaxID=126569 RepID=A0ABQ6NRV3_9BACL|nr:hypothetical protein [Paenibacillus glycanilyticus]GMK46785.1 hypothetical protein PghCCS26_39140 [Paenibacillus glycanilyticus]